MYTATHIYFRLPNLAKNPSDLVEALQSYAGAECWAQICQQLHAMCRVLGTELSAITTYHYIPTFWSFPQSPFDMNFSMTPQLPQQLWQIQPQHPAYHGVWLSSMHCIPAEACALPCKAQHTDSHGLFMHNTPYKLPPQYETFQKKDGPCTVAATGPHAKAMC